MGRHKIALEKITSKHERQITFSKRRTGLFSKAKDLAREGCEVAVIVFSAVDNVFTFSHPSVEAVVGRFLGQEDINLAGGALVEAPGSESEGNEGLAGPPREGEAPPTEEDERDMESESAQGDAVRRLTEHEEDKQEGSGMDGEQEGSGMDGERDDDDDGDGYEGEEEKLEEVVAMGGESLAEEPLDSGRFWWNDRIDDLELEELEELESSLVGLRDRVRDHANKILVEKPVMGFSFNFNNSEFKFRHED